MTLPDNRQSMINNLSTKSYMELWEQQTADCIKCLINQLICSQKNERSRTHFTEKTLISSLQCRGPSGTRIFGRSGQSEANYSPVFPIGTIIIKLLLYYYYCYYYYTVRYVGQENLVVIATRYGSEGPRIDSWWGRDFLHPSRPALEPTQPPIEWVSRLSRGLSVRGVELTTHNT